MAINNVTLNTGIPGSTGMISATDNESKNLQNQLLNKQQRLKQLSSDSKMTAEEKAKERQEIQKQIAELNRKLRQQQMERTEEAKEATKKQEEKKFFKEEMLEEQLSKEPNEEAVPEEQQEKSKIEDMSVPVASIHKMLAADSMLQQTRVQESVTVQKNGVENVLAAEIKSDSLYGTDTTAKREALSDMRREDEFLIEPQKQENQNSYNMHYDAKIIFRG